MARPADAGGSPERLAALSDGVMAIVMTLLALDIRLPRPAEGMSNADLFAAIVATLPNLGAYALSFVVIAQFWRLHHVKFARLTRVDNGVFWLNTLFLLLTGIIPFVTSMLAENPDALATAAYAAVVAAVSLALSAVSLYAGARGFIDGADPKRAVRATLARSLSVAAVFLISIPIAFFWDSDLAKYFWLVLIPTGFLARAMNSAETA